MVLLAVMSGLIFGLWRGGVGQSGLDYYEQLTGSKVEISGRITDDPDIDKRNRTVLRLTDIHMGSSSLPGNVWVTTNKSDVIRRSDIVTVSGKMRAGAV